MPFRPSVDLQPKKHTIIRRSNIRKVRVEGAQVPKYTTREYHPGNKNCRGISLVIEHEPEYGNHIPAVSSKNILHEFHVIVPHTA